MYPTEQPSAKCDLISRRLPVNESLKEFFGFDSAASLFQALKQPLPSDLKLLSTLYIYPSDAPSPPMSRSLAVIGVADVSLKVVRQLIGEAIDEENTQLPACLTKSTVAVRRADGAHKNDMEERHLQNSTVFSKFMRRLASEGVVAIIAPDKFGRFGILSPSSRLMADDASTSSHDYYARVYLGRVDTVKEYLTQGEEPQTPPFTAQDDSASSSGLWAPPGASSLADDSANGLWQPPTTDDAGNGLWQPPGASGAAMNYDFGDAAAATFPSDTTTSDVSNKRKLEDFHGDSGAAAADAFYSSLTRTLETRADSRIYHLRAYNGWVKATQIQELNPKTKNNRDGPLRILDLACGKGGDLGKWTLHQRGVRNYVGSDVARGSLKDAAIRARRMRGKLKQCTFTCADLGADVPGRLKGLNHKYMQKLLTWSLQNESAGKKSDPIFQMVRGGGISLDDHFDVVSIQFAIHYMMSSKQRARRFFQTVSELLDVGGNLIVTTIDARRVVWHLMNMGIDLHFDDVSNHDEGDVVISVGNGACKLRFQRQVVRRIFTADTNDPTGDDMFGLEYSFTLVEGDDHSHGVGDAVNLPEWLTPIPVLVALASEAGLELESAENFHEFFHARSNPLVNVAAHSSMYSMKALNRNGTIASDEWEISGMYVAVKFRKVRDSTMQVEESDEDETDDEDERGAPEAPRDIDPKLKIKLMPIALMKAKKTVGADVWQSLASDEKSRLTEIELAKLASASP
ncbi:hypothetical protein MPSEU_000257200 [Mayamaea pseudoterrestris]|nr:hypothetical protein MPSEU_000257200 [Mayamaea pseudoterrestris]